MVGTYDIETGTMGTSPIRFFLNMRMITYAAEFPDGNPGNAWSVFFEPSQNIQTASGGQTISKAIITLRPSQDLTKPIQSTRIRFKISDSWAFQNTRWPWAHIIQSDTVNNKTKTIVDKFMWLLASVVGRWGRYSGQVLTDEYNIETVVKVKPFHLVTFQAQLLQDLRPNEITSLPIIVTNRGNYNDTIGFRAVTAGGFSIQTTGNNTITLAPGEQGNALIGVAVPPNLLDTGTLHSITIQAYSAEQPSIPIGEQILPLETQGIFISMVTGASIIGILAVIVLFILLLFLLRRRIAGRSLQAPQKPWTIPEEQEHLAALKRTNKDAYDKERAMMNDEYRSAMLWYDDYKKTIRIQRRISKETKGPSKISITKKITTRFTRLTTRRPKKAKPKRVKTPSPEPTTNVDTERDRTLRRILKEQKRQARSTK